MAAWTDSTYSITFNARGQKFYGSDAAGADVNIIIISDLVVSAKKITFASASLDASCTLTASVVERQSAEVSIDAGSVTVVAGTEILKSLVIINIIGELQATAQKTAFASASLSGEVTPVISATKVTFASGSSSIDSSLTPTAYKIAKASSSVDFDLSTITTALEILLAKINVSGFVVTVTVGKEILLAKITAAATLSSRPIPAIKFSPSITEDTQDIRPLVLIDGKPVTEHNRKLDVTVIQSFVENRNWAAKRRRYYKTSPGRLLFKINWSMLPNSRDMTVDNKYGRDFISDIGSQPKSHTIKILDIDSDGTTPYTESEYTVIVKNYSENLVRRDLVDDTYYWDCNIELEQV